MASAARHFDGRHAWPPPAPARPRAANRARPSARKRTSRLPEKQPRRQKKGNRKAGRGKKSSLEENSFEKDGRQQGRQQGIDEKGIAGFGDQVQRAQDRCGQSKGHCPQDRWRCSKIHFQRQCRRQSDCRQYRGQKDRDPEGADCIGCDGKTTRHEDVCRVGRKGSAPKSRRKRITRSHRSGANGRWQAVDRRPRDERPADQRTEIPGSKALQNARLQDHPRTSDGQHPQPAGSQAGA